MNERSADVIIVGAGAAGLMAARELKRAGNTVLVLEARPRAGGRILTVRSDGGIPIELGAEFIHGEAPETMKLVDEAGIATVPVMGDHFRSRSGKLALQNDIWDEMKKVFRLMNPDRKTDRSFQDFLDTEPGGSKMASERKLATAFVQGFMAADTKLISEKSLAAQGDPTEGAAEARRIVNGYGPLVDFLAREVSDAILFESTVARVVRDETGVTVFDDRGAQYRGHTAIITVPLPMLQDDSIVFEPEIPEIRKAASRLVMGQVVRVTMTVTERFWEEKRKNIAFLHSPGRAFNAWWTQNPIASNVLMGWSGGPPAVELMESGDIENSALMELADFFGMRRTSIDKLVKSIHTHDWRDDPYSRGAYSYTGVGGMSAPKVLARAVDDLLFFAGEATDSESSGTVEAGFASGKRAAKQVLKRLSAIA
jgi:monoamine oxidase